MLFCIFFVLFGNLVDPSPLMYRFLAHLSVGGELHHGLGDTSGHSPGCTESGQDYDRTRKRHDARKSESHSPERHVIRIAFLCLL